MNSFLRLSMITLIGAVLVAICGAAAATTTIRATIPVYSSKTAPYFKRVGRAFEKANPDIRVQFAFVPWDNLRQKLTTNISSNSNADIALVSSRWLYDFIHQDIAQPLSSYITPAFKERFFQPILKRSETNGKIYGLPIAGTVRAMYYNKTLFKNAGIGQPPQSWAELKADAKKISALGDDIYGFGIQGAASETDIYFDYVLRSYGGGLLRKDGTSGFDTQAAFQAAGMYKSLIDSNATEPGVTSNTRVNLQDLFKRGKLGMVITASFLARHIESQAPNLKYGLVPVPAGPGGHRGTYSITDSLIMFQNSEHKEEAWKFMKFLMQKKWNSIFVKNEGSLPAIRKVAKEPYFQKSAYLKFFTNLLPDAHFLPLIPSFNKVVKIEIDAMQTIYLGNGKIQPTLKQAAREANKLLDSSY